MLNIPLCKVLGFLLKKLLIFNILVCKVIGLLLKRLVRFSIAVRKVLGFLLQTLVTWGFLQQNLIRFYIAVSKILPFYQTIWPDSTLVVTKFQVPFQISQSDTHCSSQTFRVLTGKSGVLLHWYLHSFGVCRTKVAQIQQCFLQCFRLLLIKSSVKLKVDFRKVSVFLLKNFSQLQHCSLQSFTLITTKFVENQNFCLKFYASY